MRTAVPINKQTNCNNVRFKSRYFYETALTSVMAQQSEHSLPMQPRTRKFRESP